MSDPVGCCMHHLWIAARCHWPNTSRTASKIILSCFTLNVRILISHRSSCPWLESLEPAPVSPLYTSTRRRCSPPSSGTRRWEPAPSWLGSEESPASYSIFSRSSGYLPRSSSWALSPLLRGLWLSSSPRHWERHCPRPWRTPSQLGPRARGGFAPLHAST